MRDLVLSSLRMFTLKCGHRRLTFLPERKAKCKPVSELTVELIVR